MKVDNLSDFKDIIKYYNHMIEFAKRLNPKAPPFVAIDYIKNFSSNDLSPKNYYRAFANNLSLYISQLHERSLSISEEELLEATFDDFEGIETFEGKKEELSILDKKRHIRNALAHADYTIEFDRVYEVSKPVQEAKIYLATEPMIKIDNDYISGRIKFDELLNIAEKYRLAFAKITTRGLFTGVFDPNINKAKTTDDFINGLRKYRVVQKEKGKGLSYDKFKYNFFKKFKIPKESQMSFIKAFDAAREKDYSKDLDFEEESVTEETKSFIKQYIDYVGFSRFKRDYDVQLALNDILSPYLTNTVAINNITALPNLFFEMNDINTRAYFMNKSGASNSQMVNAFSLETGNLADSIIKLSYEAPFLYANNLLGYAYYCFGFVRETNENFDRSIFDFYDIKNLEGVKAKLTDRKGIVTEVDIYEEVNPREKAERRLTGVKAQMDNLRKEKANKTKIETDLQNPKNKNPRKKEILESLKEWFNKFTHKEQELALQESLLESERDLADDVDYKDTITFFRHLRNSMAHGNYDVNYGDFSDSENVEFTFRDHDEDTDSLYEVTVSAKKLEEIIHGFEEKVLSGRFNLMKAEISMMEFLNPALRNRNINLTDISEQFNAERRKMKEEKDDKKK